MPFRVVSMTGEENAAPRMTAIPAMTIAFRRLSTRAPNTAFTRFVASFRPTSTQSQIRKARPMTAAIAMKDIYLLLLINV